MHRNIPCFHRLNHNSEKGFTLLEILIVLSIVGLVTSVIYRGYRSQLNLFVSQSQVQNMQQTLRGVMDVMVSDLRMAGYEQRYGTNAGFKDPVGITFSALAGQKEIRFTSDRGNCLPTEGCQAGVIDNKEDELIGYKLDDGVIRRYSPGRVRWQPLAENIEALDFVYLDKDRNRLGDLNGNISDPSDFEKIRSVQITIVARASEKAPVLSFNTTDERAFSNLQGDILVFPKKDKVKRMAISTEVQLRNWRI